MLQDSREAGSIDRRCICRVPVPGGVEAESVDCIVIKICPSPVPLGPDGDLILLPSTIKAAEGYCGSLTGTAGKGPIGGGDGGGASEGDKEHLAVLPFKLVCLWWELFSFSSSSMIVVVVDGDFWKGCDDGGCDRGDVLSSEGTKLLRKGLLDPIAMFGIFLVSVGNEKWECKWGSPKDVELATRCGF